MEVTLTKIEQKETTTSHMLPMLALAFVIPN